MKIKKIFLILSIFLIICCNKNNSKKDYSKLKASEVYQEVQEIEKKIETEKNKKKKAELERKSLVLFRLASIKDGVENGVFEEPERMKIEYKSEEKIKQMTLEELYQEANMINSKVYYEGEFTEKDEKYIELVGERISEEENKKNSKE